MKRIVCLCVVSLLFVVIMESVCLGKNSVVSTRQKVAEQNESKAHTSDKTQLRTTIKSLGRQTILSVKIWVEVANEGMTPAKMCRYETPFEEEGVLTSSLTFSVVNSEGKELEYTGGSLFRRNLDCKAGDYLVIEPGQSIHTQIDIANSYYWYPGKYKVTFVGDVIFDPIPRSNTIEIRVSHYYKYSNRL